MRDIDLGGARAPAPAVTVAAVPAALGARLAPYQRDGVAWILGHLCGRGTRSCILADAAGLGKTVQAIAAVAALVARGAARRVLVVAPAGVVGVWEAEFARFAGDSVQESPEPRRVFCVTRPKSVPTPEINRLALRARESPSSV